MSIDLKPSEAMAAEAERGLRWREEYNRGGTAIGVARARDISNRKNLSPSTVRRMVSYFARHEVDKNGQGFSPGEEGYPSAGRIAWALWGGDSGKSWANQKSSQLEKESTNQSFKMELLTIENKAGKVRLNESVNPDSMTRLIEEIDLVFGAKAFADGVVTGEITNSIENAADTLDIEIHSPGGSVLDGYKLYHAILELRGRGVYVTATINSLAASMASVIAMAADKIRMVKGGRMMIHEASQVVAGNAEDLARASKLLDEISGEIADIYAERTGGKREEMRELMKDETWMGADEAMKRKFIDEVVGKNSIDSNAKKLQKQSNNMSILDRLLPNADLSAKYEAAQAELAGAESTISDLTNRLKEADSLIAEAVEEARGFQNQVVTAKAETEAEKEAHAATRKELVEASALLEPVALAERITASVNSEDEADAPLKEAIEKEVTNRIVAAGHKPLDTIQAEQEEANHLKMGREAFNSLSSVEKNAFMRNGGKLTD
jgi:ATP-dependent protease ClpP protease subunit